MKKEEIVQQLLEEKLISIVRLKNGQYTSKVIDALVQGGIKVLEITSNTPGFEMEIADARKKYPNILIGAGTISNTELALKALKAGAQFLVTPNTNKEVMDKAIKADIPVAMGALTPTEIANAVAYGADIIKLFPSDQLGVSYFKSLKGPFSETKFFAVGGIGMDNLEEWFKAGIDGVGVASTLVKKEASKQEDLIEIVGKAQQFVAFTKKYGRITD
ncbi:bifunctional 4-hydroxy-2-oxoglutarate aldolase/2-dehydro-3-deoxy-phosphogluconate aldolase [Flagellimonas flava]|uniref:bifunctional 4-hydroxy-2-oxoglutarate aldolase/2-dehydro-3-deoxy-phosphogluconate aldolase n=1 Tax=Flagellimonas flava TaxID=570519 RepID=UPI003D647A9B